MESLNTRQELLLKALIESFISDGQPVGSSKLSKASDIGISSATIRNVFVDLEDLGYIYSPHKSAGRVPTELAYRMFVDKMIKVQPVNNNLIEKLKLNLTQDAERKNIVKFTSEILPDDKPKYVMGLGDMHGLIDLIEEEITLREENN